eukprot:TRINITY_DN6439_c0_g2_i1.p1 TRINITY_DN6439_c0_g2~~TRINITY_DN6439_c0_g2_i1.p1  ORF type:complete len:456 (-),score=73.29 TRINITY_DN6439_c0_g2_i1:54-1421(-)
MRDGHGPHLRPLLHHLLELIICVEAFGGTWTEGVGYPLDQRRYIFAALLEPCSVDITLRLRKLSVLHLSDRIYLKYSVSPAAMLKAKVANPMEPRVLIVSIIKTLVDSISSQIDRPPRAEIDSMIDSIVSFVVGASEQAPTVQHLIQQYLAPTSSEAVESLIIFAGQVISTVRIFLASAISNGELRSWLGDVDVPTPLFLWCRMETLGVSSNPQNRKPVPRAALTRPSITYSAIDLVEDDGDEDFLEHKPADAAIPPGSRSILVDTFPHDKENRPAPSWLSRLIRQHRQESDPKAAPKLDYGPKLPDALPKKPKPIFPHRKVHVDDVLFDSDSLEYIEDDPSPAAIAADGKEEAQENQPAVKEHHQLGDEEPEIFEEFEQTVEAEQAVEAKEANIQLEDDDKPALPQVRPTRRTGLIETTAVDLYHQIEPKLKKKRLNDLERSGLEGVKFLSRHL